MAEVKPRNPVPRKHHHSSRKAEFPSQTGRNSCAHRVQGVSNWLDSKREEKGITRTWLANTEKRGQRRVRWPVSILWSWKSHLVGSQMYRGFQCVQRLGLNMRFRSTQKWCGNIRKTRCPRMHMSSPQPTSQCWLGSGYNNPVLSEMTIR